MHIAIANVRIDGGTRPSADFKVLLRVVCELVVSVGGTEVFREVEFPFVEFASQVSAWRAPGGARDFNFESMDSSVHGLVYFRRTDDEWWSVGSMLPGSPLAQTVTTDELHRGVDAFLASVPPAADILGVDVRRFIERERDAATGRGE